MFPYLLGALNSLLFALWLGRAGLFAAQIYQIEEYEDPRLLEWGRRPAWQRARPWLIALGLAAAFGLAAQFLPGRGPQYGGLVAVFVGAAELNLYWRRPPAKKPLVYTPRLRRMINAALASLVLAALLCAVGLALLPAPFNWLLGLATLALAPNLALRLPILASRLTAPLERRIQQGFVDQARQRLAQIKPRVVGIAGSYGKTSTKQIAGQLLAPQIATLPTPKSFNTLMGVTRTVNEYMTPEHQLFLVEMDAYGAGEIAAMCDLVRPEIAVITSVGPQHLERFGTVAAIGSAIYELVTALPAGGTALIYCGDPETAALAQRAAAEGYRVIRYGIAGDHPALDLVVRDLVMSGAGTRFRLEWAAEGLSAEVQIPLLSRHNALNTAAGIALVHLLGADWQRAVAQAAHLEFVPNRLQIIRGAGGVTVIDDSYNANPVGVHNALEVLSQIESGRRILVTPGMVELGSVQDAENRRYGEHAGQICDHVILVGRAQTVPIAEGLRAAGMAEEQIAIVQTLDEVTALLGQFARPGDVVLFANDLPDTYLEA